MDEGFAVGATVVEILRNLVESLTRVAPRVITVIVLLILGVLVAKLFEKLLAVLLGKLRVDGLFDRLGATRFAQRLGVGPPLSRKLARLGFYFAVILFVQAAAEALQLTAIGDAIRAFFGYVPNLLAAALVFLLGNAAARVGGRAVTESALDSGVEYATGLGRLVSLAILLVASIMAIAQLGIDTTLLRIVIFTAMAVTGVSIALAFGLGTREIARNLVAGFYIRKLFGVGNEVEVGKYRGTLIGVTPTKTLLQSKGKRMAIANRVLLDETVEQEATGDE